MTKAEYARLYRQAFANINDLSLETLRRIRATYIREADKIAKVVREAELAGKSVLTISSQSAIEAELRRSAEIIRHALEQESPELIATAYKQMYAVDAEYIMSAVKDAGITRISIGQLNAFASAINNRLNAIQISRIWQDGYTFSDRVWNTGLGFQDEIKTLLQGGLIQGRDPIRLAKDLTEYVRKGSGVLEGRWGKLVPGARDYRKRIPRNIDYRALRLVRSELYASLQEAGRLEGQLNPAATSYYNWVLEAGSRPAADPCPDIAAASPYRLEDLPSFPHPNCRCHIYPVLRDRREFVNDLQRWSNGESVDYLDAWEERAEMMGLTI